MILLDHPYVSDFLLDTIRTHGLPTVDTPAARALTDDADLPWVDADAVIRAAARDDFRLYTTSENALRWVGEHLAFTDLPEKAALFKDKARFRDLIADHYPDFTYRRVSFAQLGALPVESLPFPLVVKPSVGFFSIGVHIVPDAAAWPEALAAIRDEFSSGEALFPPEVLDATAFILEAYIEGDEYAVDAYFDAEGEPVILNILKHEFSSASDVSDRIYTTSKRVITTLYAPVRGFLAEVGRLAGLRNFPLHVELRMSGSRLVPIEVNPLRFGGWCTTPDLTALAYGLNPYLAFLRGEKPDWDALLADKDDLLYSLVILDNATGYAPEQIAAFDYDALLSRFCQPLELRRLDYRQFPVFGFLFLETPASQRGELDYILFSSLREFVRLTPA